MTTNLSQAVRDAGAWLALLEDSQDELDVTLLNAWNYPPLTLGTVRVLYDLAHEISEIADRHIAETVARRFAAAPRTSVPPGKIQGN